MNFNNRKTKRAITVIIVTVIVLAMVVPILISALG